MTMFRTLRLDLVILPTSYKAHLELEGWPADQIPQSVGWAQAAWLLCFGAVPRQRRGAARPQQEQLRQAGALCKLESWRHLAAVEGTQALWESRNVQSCCCQEETFP